MHTAILSILLTLVPGQSGLNDSAASSPDTVVVCPAAFREAMQPWIEFREAQGHRIAVVSNAGTDDDVRKRVFDTAKKDQLRFVVLVGDAVPDNAWYRDAWAQTVPVHYAKARINVLWGSEPTIATDNWYAQPEDDADEKPRPRYAVGRLTADSPDDLTRMIQKILDYERSNDFGAWRQRMNFVAGVGGFGPLADMVLETAAKQFLTQSIPAEYRVSMTYASWRSPFCPDPRRFHQTTLDRLNEGSLFWVYIGHGQPLGVDRVHVPGAQYPILTTADSQQMDCRHGRPIALFMSCYTGAIDARQDCLAEEMLRAPGGPIAILAGSRVTMPYAMTVLAKSLTDECFQKHCDTLGEALLHAKQTLLAEPRVGDQQRAMLDAMARAISPAPDQLATERAEQVLLFNLIGDPLLRLHHPKSIKLSVPKDVAAGNTVQIEGTCSIEGHGTLELVLRRDRSSIPRPNRPQYPQTPEELAAFQEIYQKTNDRRMRAVELDVRGGRFVAQLDVPPETEGACHICMLVSGKDDFALGSVDVDVKRTTSDRTTSASARTTALPSR